MEVIRKNLLRLKCLLTTTTIHDDQQHQQQQQIREITKYDIYLGLCHKLLCWEDISFTLTTFLAINFLFWITTLFQIPILGLISLIILIMFLIDSNVDIKQLADLNFNRLEKLEQFRNEFNDFWINVRGFRKENPSSFCLSASAVSIGLTILARNISGYVLSYFAILSIFFGPLLFNQLPPEVAIKIKQIFTLFSLDRGVLAEDELIPFLTDPDERDGDQDSLMTDRTAESVTNSLVSGLNTMPSHLDADDKESLEEDDLLPTLPDQQSGVISYTPGDLSSDSDNENREIRFDSSHFNSSSSSSSCSLSDDKEPVDLTNVVQNNSDQVIMDHVYNNLVNAANAGSSFMVNAIKTAVGTALNPSQQQQQHRGDHSSDSEFEIIEYDETD